MTDRASLGMQAILLVVLLLTLGLHSAHYYPFIVDDALISLRYSQRLLDGHGLTWTDGEPVEGYTNLLWVLLVAAWGALFDSLIAGVRVIGLAGMGLAVAALLATSRIRQPGELLAFAAGGFALVLSGPTAVWAIGGLEQPLLIGLLAWALVLTPRALHDRNTLIITGTLLALVALTRADGILFSFAVGLWVWLGRDPSRRSAWQAAAFVGLPVLAVVCQLIFRLAYYDDWIPNTAYAKFAPTKQGLREGYEYLRDATLRHAAIAIPATATVCVALARRMFGHRIILCATVALVWQCYVILIRGDWFPAHRQFLPVVLCGALLVQDGVRLLAARLPERVTAIAVLVATLMAVHLVAQLRDPGNWARKESWVWNYAAIGNTLRAAFKDRQPLIAVDIGGALPFFSGLPALDSLGLNDRYLAHHRPDNFGRREIGHELGDGRYVLSRSPDLVQICMWHSEPGACWRGGQELLEQPAFRRAYRLVSFAGTEPVNYRTGLWVRIESGKIGIERKDGRIRIPGYLFATTKTSTARLDSEGVLAAMIDADGEGEVTDLVVGPGRWRLAAEGTGSGLWIIVNSPAGEHRGSELELVLKEEIPVSLRIESGAEPAWVYSVLLERLE